MSADDPIALYRELVRLRVFEQITVRQTMADKFVGSIHVAIGQEAIAVGVCSALDRGDVIGITYRGRAQALARGVAPERIWAEMMGRETGTSRGKGGPMHVGDPARGVLTANAIVGAGIPITAGAALGLQAEGGGQVAVAFFGEGAVNQGVFTETVNMASLMKLPLIFVCESNQYAEMTRAADASASADLISRVAPFGMPALEVDGNDVEAVAGATATAVARARGGEGPTFLDAQTYRLSGHMVGDGNSYRSKEEIAERQKVEPLVRYGETLRTRDLLDDARAAAIQAEIEAVLEEAWAMAEASPLAPEQDAFTDVYADERATS